MKRYKIAVKANHRSFGVDREEEDWDCGDRGVGKRAGKSRRARDIAANVMRRHEEGGAQTDRHSTDSNEGRVQ